ncbi:MAG TPA: pantoate--beta-alanine ligase [Xanthobacteraceae bacterium]|nr:pantoate--beta-alanine ligase [Xanthobacteraceae bacterium]
MSQPAVARSAKALRAATAPWRKKNQKIALVPTMGALHAGHIKLVRAAGRKADRTIVSIFVNPAQFGPKEDLTRYPRTWREDLEKLTAEKIDLIYAPTVREMYPEGFATKVTLEGPALGLETDFRPHFFAGVATVVAKLLAAALPDYAMFGEKDYQQLQVVKQMVSDLNLPVEIVPVPTVRERDGLALSSRNAYLSVAERAAAPTLHRVLQETAASIRKGAPVGPTLVRGRRTIKAAGFKLDYLEARHASNLAPITSRKDGPIRLLVAARIGGTRLIDNMAI